MSAHSRTLTDPNLRACPLATDQTGHVSQLWLNHVWPAVGKLFNLGGPFAVARLIITIVVNPVKRHAHRPWSHILGKCNNGVKPLRADGYPATTVVLPILIVGIGAAADHVRPGSVFRCVAHAVRWWSAPASLPYGSFHTPNYIPVVAI